MRKWWFGFVRLQLAGLSFVACGILLVAALVRLVGLGTSPFLINQDELSNIYDGYSLATTGADRFGQRFPFTLTGFGGADFRPALGAWLIALPSFFSGFSIAVARSVSGLLGIASLLLLYLLARRLVSERFALVALLLASLSPWHILFSRMAHEGAILPAFFAVAIAYAFVRAHDSGFGYSSLAVGGFLCGFSTNAYQATRVTGCLYTIVFLWALGRECAICSRTPRLLEFLKKSLVVGGSALLAAGPQIFILLTQPEHFLGRAKSAMAVPELSVSFGEMMVSNFIKNLSPYFLCLDSYHYNNLSLARLLPVEIVFFYLGLVVVPFVIPESSR